jgi:hypothetical protein
MGLEHYWYETSPFVYTVAGGVMLGTADSSLAVISSIILLTAAGTIFFLRRTYARTPDKYAIHGRADATRTRDRVRRTTVSH